MLGVFSNICHFHFRLPLISLLFPLKIPASGNGIGAHAVLSLFIIQQKLLTYDYTKNKRFSFETLLSEHPCIFVYITVLHNEPILLQLESSRATSALSIAAALSGLISACAISRL